MKQHEVTDEQWEVFYIHYPQTYSEDGAPTIAPACDAQRHSLDSPYRVTLAGPARAVRSSLEEEGKGVG